MTMESNPKRRKWYWVAGAVLVFVLLAAGKETERVEPGHSDASPGQSEPVAGAVEKPFEEVVPEEPPAPEVEWNTHEFTVVEDGDSSFPGRARRRVIIVAPTALTREDRIATLVEAVKRTWRKHHSQFIGIMLLPFESSFSSVARIEYAPDGCGVSGKDCTGRVWKAYASDAIFTPEHAQISIAWQNNRDRFMEMDDDYGFEFLNEDRLKAFLAEQFDTTVEDVSEKNLDVIMSSASQQEMTIPDRLAR